MIVEYPSYGVYKTAKPSEERIFEDSLTVFDFFVDVMKFQPENIIIFGRSIGTCPACYLASSRNSFILVLISPFLTFKKLVYDKIKFLNFLVQERFENEKFMENIKSPLFILHGKKVN